MINDAKQATSTPKYGFLLDELHRQGFLIGVGDMLKVHRYFNTLWEHPLSIGDLKAQLAALICHSVQDQKLFYEWFDKWAVIIEKRTENLIAQLEPIEVIKTDTPIIPIENKEKPIETPPPPPNISQTSHTDTFVPTPSLKKRKGPINIQLTFPPNPIRFWNLAEFDAVLPILREKKWVESTEWDTKASIRRTIHAGGMPQFVLKQKRQTPQYLMLIEQQSVRDHLATFYADLAEELSRRDLNVTYYYYDITPATCWRERNNPRTHVSLEQLQGEYADARLFIVGNAETLLKTTQLEPSAVALSIWETWKETAILSPRGTGDWGRAELAIGQLFPVIPSNGLGFQSLTTQWQGTEHFTPTYWQLKNPEPRTPNVAEFVVVERPENVQRNVIPLSYIVSLPSWKTITPEDENQLNLLYFYLNDGAYRWLCAAALYPEIYYELTRLYADEVIAKDQHLSEWEQNRLWCDALRLVLRLDWFRKGQIPTHFRGLLRDDFSIERALVLNNPQFEQAVKKVREQLLKVLKLPQNTEGVPEDSYAAANQAFTQVWIESEMANNLADIPQKMAALEISMSDVEDAVGQQLWFVEGQKLEEANTKRAKTLYAVIIGIDSYAMPSLQLADCRNDANAMNQYLKAFCTTNDIVYNNQILFDEQARRMRIIDSFKHFEQAQDGDMCIFYFAGRGAQIPAPPEFTDEPDGMSETLLCYDSRTDNQNGRELADKELAYLIYKATQNKNVHFLSITDACHSGEENTRTKKKSTVAAGLGIKAEEYLGFEEYINYQPPTANYIHLGAAQSHETTKEVKIESVSRGAFTFALVKILEEVKGLISYKDLLNRVKEDVKKRVQEQTPTLATYGMSIETPFLGIKPKETQPTSETAPLSKKPKTGRLLFDLPKQMEVGKEYRCVVRIAHDDTPLFQNMEHTTNTPAQDIQISEIMSVELLDPHTKTTFTIRTLTDAQQLIDAKEMTEWVFFIKPLQENQHALSLKVAVIEAIDGKERRREEVVEETVEVTTFIKKTTVSLKKHVQQLIIHSEIRKALDVLLNWSENNDGELYNKIILLSSRYNALKNEVTGELIDDSNAHTNIARITLALNTYLNDDVPNDAFIKVEETLLNKLKILMITANQISTDGILLEREHSQIMAKIDHKVNNLVVKLNKAVNRAELKELTETDQPDILHFSGHGKRSEIGDGIILQNDEKNGCEIISTQELDILFKYFKSMFSLKAVVLSACYSEEQAKVIAKYVPYVMGTAKEIEDEFAAAFSVGFYFGLVESGRNFESAFAVGKTQAMLTGAGEKDFVLYKNGKIVSINLNTASEQPILNKNVKEYLNEGNIKLAIEVLSQNTEAIRNEDLITNVLVIKGRYANLEQKIINGIISKADEDIERGILTNTLVELDDEVNKISAERKMQSNI